MFGYLILLFTVLPALELALLIKIGAQIGVANTLSIIILTGVAGAYLARFQGFVVIRNIQESLNRGHMPTEEMINGVLIFVGGIVLLTPGFVTDTLGFLLLIPWTRSLIKLWAKAKLEKGMNDGSIVTFNSHEPPRSNNQDYEDADFH